MTIKEHIENLKAIASDMPSDKCSDWIESLMAGVKALEQQPCEDAISREETLKALMDEWTEFDSELIDSLIGKIKKLSSVTPQPKPNIKALGEDIRICQKSIIDKNVLIGFNMAVALCNKHLAERSDKE